MAPLMINYTARRSRGSRALLFLREGFGSRLRFPPPRFARRPMNRSLVGAKSWWCSALPLIRPNFAAGGHDSQDLWSGVVRKVLCGHYLIKV